MRILRTPSAAAARVFRTVARPLVLVPTMGALHEGHLELIRRARTLAGPGGSVAVSIFVNPTQFGPNEDFSRYPRPITEDTAKCKAAGVDLLFAPAAGDMYEPDSSTWVDDTLLSVGLCGGARPGHFRGVCTVVSKLFNIVGPDVAVFGKKDAQQLAIIRRMVRDLNFQIKVVGVETFREPDGLALSSRNQYLTADQRLQAPIIRKSLVAARKWAKELGKSAIPRRSELQWMIAGIIHTMPLAKIDYVEVVDASTLGVPSMESRHILIAVAVYFGKTRLIDNIEIPM